MESVVVGARGVELDGSSATSGCLPTASLSCLDVGSDRSVTHLGSGSAYSGSCFDSASLVSAETQPRSPIRVLYEKGAGTLLHLVQESDGQVPEIGREETRHGLPALGPRRLPHRVQLRL